MPAMQTPGIKASDVWAVATRTLSDYSDVWAVASRTLSSSLAIGTQSIADNGNYVFPANYRLIAVWREASNNTLQINRTGVTWETLLTLVNTTWVLCNISCDGAKVRVLNDASGAAKTIYYLYELIS